MKLSPFDVIVKSKEILGPREFTVKVIKFLNDTGENTDQLTEHLSSTRDDEYSKLKYIRELCAATLDYKLQLPAATQIIEKYDDKNTNTKRNICLQVYPLVNKELLMSRVPTKYAYDFIVCAQQNMYECYEWIFDKGYYKVVWMIRKNIYETVMKEVIANHTCGLKD